MEGRSVVSVSLPVRIFEKRSAIERICDLWSTGPIYLVKAGQAATPLEKLKQVITFVVSGSHLSVDMRKPFNPIIGETFEGFWPDGTKIYCEHISHHPPISTYLIEHPQGLFKAYGSLEYVGKMSEFGNVLSGGIIGKNHVEFPDGTHIVYDLAPITISGLIWG